MTETLPTAFDIWDEANPRSLVNILPVKTADQIREAAKSHPDLFGLDERSLRAEFKKLNYFPNATDNRLRINFWMEYERAQTVLKPMVLNRICDGVIVHGYFTDRYLRNPFHVAWMLTPITGYETVATEALQYGLETLRDILGEDHTLPGGGLNLKLVELKLKVVAMLDLRLKGIPTQRIEQKTLGYTLHDSMKDVSAHTMGTNMIDLEARMKELERRERRALNLPEPSTPAPESEKAIDAEFTQV